MIVIAILEMGEERWLVGYWVWKDVFTCEQMCMDGWMEYLSGEYLSS